MSDTPTATEEIPLNAVFGEIPEDWEPNSYFYCPEGPRELYENLAVGMHKSRMWVPTIYFKSVICAAIFLHRDVWLAPETACFAYQANLYSRGLAAHIPRDLSRLFRLIEGFLDTDPVEKRNRLATIIGWVHAYLTSGALPALPREPIPPRVITTGSDGFVMAEASDLSNLDVTWEELWRLGHLKGVIFGPACPSTGGRVVSCRAKSRASRFDLYKANQILREAEAAMGEPCTWDIDEDFRLGSSGTLLLPSQVMEVLVRV